MIPLIIAPDGDRDISRRLSRLFPPPDDPSISALPNGPVLRLDVEGLALVSGDQVLRGDFTRLLHRLKPGALSGELLVRAAKPKSFSDGPTALDATAGLGEDSFLLAAAGFQVTLCERNPIIYELLQDALERAAQHPELAPIAARIHAIHDDSLHFMSRLETPPDVILLDPMFPERQKSALVKKKLQMIQKLELPCDDEESLLRAAVTAAPKKLIVKRPPKGPHLAGIRPDYSLTGKAVRFDCFASPTETVFNRK